MRNGLFEPDAPAAGQVTPDHIERFLEELRSRIGSVTLAGTIYKVRRASELLEPERDLAWLGEIEKDLALVMRPISKGHRIVDPDRLVEAGLSLVQEANDNPSLTPLRRARQVRNGVMVALLALCPIRLKNFVALDLQANFRRIGSRWWIVLDRKHTKSGRPDERRVPRDLDAAIASYLLIHRPVLRAVEGRTRGAMSDIEHLPANRQDPAVTSAETLDAVSGPLWLSSNSGARMSYSGVELTITATTLLTLGVEVGPHLFRASAATAIYTYAGDNPNLASAVLQHVDRRVTEEHYNHATSTSAARQYAEIVKRRRGGFDQ
ncbi:site-specific integrase [Methylocella tundrae]|nr:site-specific integrase [Methylocella tundrae]WPP04214.1 site-specific integrase [Methylocella tundrae]